MSHDMQMARGAADGEINLAVGEPYFLQDLFLPQLHCQWFQKELTYPRLNGEPELLEELDRLQPQYRYKVVTNGAKQALEAAFYAYRGVYGRAGIWHSTPYWPSYPTLARNRGMEFNSQLLVHGATVHCATSPNNPDGDQKHLYLAAPDIWDAAYAQPLYGYRGIPPPHEVAVFSAAKYMGLSGIRVGWLSTNNEDLAKAAGYFVEIATSGVSIPSQVHMTAALRAMRDPSQIERLTNASFAARAALMANGASFMEFLGAVVKSVKGVPTDGSGMFAWFRANYPEELALAFKAAKVKVVTGEACGMKEPGWFRMSMGHRPEITRDALLRVREEYYR